MNGSLQVLQTSLYETIKAACSSCFFCFVFFKHLSYKNSDDYVLLGALEEKGLRVKEKLKHK